MRVYRKVIPLRWGDLDAMNHLNNTLYFRLMEEARISWFRDHDLMASVDGEGPILAHASCDFIKPMTYPCDARVTQTVTRLGRSSMDLDMLVEGDEVEPSLYAKGKNVLVWMDYRAGKSTPWPQRLVDALGDIGTLHRARLPLRRSAKAGIQRRLPSRESSNDTGFPPSRERHCESGADSADSITRMETST